MSPPRRDAVMAICILLPRSNQQKPPRLQPGLPLLRHRRLPPQAQAPPTPVAQPVSLRLAQPGCP